MEYVHSKLKYFKKEKKIGFILLSIWGTLLVVINPLTTYFIEQASLRLISLFIMLVILNILVSDYYKSRNSIYTGFFNFYSANIIEMLIFQVVTLFAAVLLYQLLYYLLVFIFLVYFMPSILYYSHIFVHWIVHGKPLSVEVESTTHYSESFSSSRRKQSGELSISEIKGVIKSLLVQLRINEETTFENLILKTAKELNLDKSLFNGMNSISIDSHLQNNDIQNIILAVREFLQEHPLEYEFIKLKDSIRKVE